MKTKKAELTTQQIVMIIILIASFAVILILIWRLDLGNTSDKDICHNSVVQQGRNAISRNLASSLSCKTSYVCISGGDECLNFNPSYTIDIDVASANAKNQLMKAIADEMSDCWWMFGEGQIDYIGFKSGNENHCAVCSVLMFDDSIQKLGPITYDEFYNYLASTKKDSAKTYLSYLYSANTPSAVSSKIKDHAGIDLSSAIIDTSKKQTIFTGANPELRGANQKIYSYIQESSKMSSSTCKIFDLTYA